MTTNLYNSKANTLTPEKLERRIRNRIFLIEELFIDAVVDDPFMSYQRHREKLIADLQLYNKLTRYGME